ncbi:MAG TPA: PQQ-binding-like beta-propeller repeat protein [Alphaproteobacteria bacterium]|nr:PQQ-binding-like beta-propeller repeat protein [Alphaproteobacteria bacterium]
MRWSVLLLPLLFAVPAVAAPADKGAGVFAEHCAACHDHPTGRIPPHYVLTHMGGDQVYRALKSGVMRQQAAGLSDADLLAVVYYLTQQTAGPGTHDRAANTCKAAGGPIDVKAPGWNGWGPDLENTRFQPAPGLAAGDVPRLKLKWAFAYPGSQAVGQPVVVGDRLFVSAVDGTIFALDAKSGCTYWSFAADSPVKGAIAVGPDRAYFGDMTGSVYAVDPMTGKLLWKVKPEAHPLAQIRGTPKLFEGRLYVPVSSGEENASGDPAYPCCTFRGSVAALDPKTGKTIWQSYSIVETPHPAGKNSAGTPIQGPAGASIWSSPTIDVKRRRLYVGTGNSYSIVENGATDAVMAFDLDTGKRLWFTQATPHDTWVICNKLGEGNCPTQIGPDYDFGSSPILKTLANGRQVVMAGQKAGTVFAFDPDDGGKVLWKVQAGLGGAFGGIEHGMAAEGDRLFVAISDFTPTSLVPADQLVPHKAGGIRALDVATGKELWHTPAPDPVCSWGKDSCSAAQAASISAIPGVVFSGSLDGHLRAYDTANGKVVWDFDAGRGFDAVNGGKANGGAISGYGQVIAGGMVYLNAGGGYFGPPGNALLAFSVDGK